MIKNLFPLFFTGGKEENGKRTVASHAELTSNCIGSGSWPFSTKKLCLFLLYILFSCRSQCLLTCTCGGGLSRHRQWRHPGSATLGKLTRYFHPVLSSSCEDKDSRSETVYFVLIWPPVHLRYMRGGVISSPSGHLAAWPSRRSILFMSCGCILVRSETLSISVPVFMKELDHQW